MQLKNNNHMNLLRSSMAMTNACQKSICIYQDCRDEEFAVKEVWD